MESVIFRDNKLIRYFVYDRDMPPYQLFDLGTDWRETKSLFTERPVTVDFLHALLRRPSPEPSAESAPIEIDERLERSLRALGYVR
jgi:hypothetical protein